MKSEMGPSGRSKLERVVEARTRLMNRWKAAVAATPAIADGRPRGTGPVNRHGMPQLPIGQHVTEGWPVLDLGFKPMIRPPQWTLIVHGECENPVKLTWEDFLAMEQVEDVSDFHCVTTWSKLGVRWKGVRMADLLALAQPTEEARFLLCHAYDKYTTNLPMEEALKPDVLLVHSVEGKPLPAEHGGPVRVITPQLYAWKGAKWIRGIELLSEDRRGFWEARGYSNTAHPWRDDRYSE